MCWTNILENMSNMHALVCSPNDDLDSRKYYNYYTTLHKQAQAQEHHGKNISRAICLCVFNKCSSQSGVLFSLQQLTTDRTLPTNAILPISLHQNLAKSIVTL